MYIFTFYFNSELFKSLIHLFHLTPVQVFKILRLVLPSKSTFILPIARLQLDHCLVLLLAISFVLSGFE